MKLRSTLSHLSLVGKLFTVLLVTLFFLLLSQLLAGVVTLCLGDTIEYQALLQLATFLQNTVGFILPSLLLAHLFGSDASSYLKVKRLTQWGWWIGGTTLCLILALPFINGVAYWNESLSFPPFFEGVEAWMRTQEELAAILTEELLATNSVGGLLLNVLLIGVLTGVGEEFLFRGVLQRVIGDATHRQHLAVWVTAIVFSAIHLQFFGFFPRLLLGALFGYLYLWSGSLWVSVFAHALNNSVAAVVFFLVERYPQLEEVEFFGSGSTPWQVMFRSILAFSFILYLMKTKIVLRIGKDNAEDEVVSK